MSDIKLAPEAVVTIRDEENNVLCEAPLYLLNSLVSAAQAGIDMKDPLQTEAWASRFAAMLSDRFTLPPEKTLGAGQALLLAHAVTTQWRAKTEAFRLGLQ